MNARAHSMLMSRGHLLGIVEPPLLSSKILCNAEYARASRRVRTAHGHGCIMCSLPRRSCAVHPLQAHVSHDGESSSSTRSSSNSATLNGCNRVCVAVLKSLVMCGLVVVRDAGAGAPLDVWHRRRIRAHCRSARYSIMCVCRVR